MTQPFIDTDVIIRLLTGDDPVKQESATSLFDQVEQGLLTLTAPDTVIADAVFVLSSPRLYHIARGEIQEMLTTLVRLPHFQVENRFNVLRSLEIYGSSNLDFGDTLIIASMEQQNSRILYSYDKGFDRIQGVNRQEP
ncbi:MAG TPA: PIN domain-containing protein [Ktedonobacteraceae bacterium]|nr:PIN domain-containing protein [Ktedonobacteraceae bacterium]